MRGSAECCLCVGSQLGEGRKETRWSRALAGPGWPCSDGTSAAHPMTQQRAPPGRSSSPGTGGAEREVAQLPQAVVELPSNSRFMLLKQGAWDWPPSWRAMGFRFSSASERSESVPLKFLHRGLLSAHPPPGQRILQVFLAAPGLFPPGVVPAEPGSLLGMQALRPHPRPAGSDPQGVLMPMGI